MKEDHRLMFARQLRSPQLYIQAILYIYKTDYMMSLTLYTLTSVCIFSMLFFIHFLMCWEGEFVQQSRGSSVGYHFLYSHDLNAWFKGDIESRNSILVTLWNLSVNNCTHFMYSLHLLATIVKIVRKANRWTEDNEMRETVNVTLGEKRWSQNTQERKLELC